MNKSWRTKKPLKWSMIVILILCWILPVGIIAFLMQYVTTSNINKQIERTILTSADKAMEICTMQMDTVVAVSRSASALPDIKKSYKKYKEDGNLVSLNRSITQFLEQNYRYNKGLLYTTIFLTENPSIQYFTSYSGTNNEAYRKSIAFHEGVMPYVLAEYENLNTDVKIFSLEGRLYIMRNIMDSSYHPYAVIVIELDKEVIFGSLKSTWGYTGDCIYMDGKILIDNTNGKWKPEPDLSYENHWKSKLVKENGEYYTYAVKKPARHYVGYVITLDKYAIIDETGAIKYIGALLILAMIPLVIIVFTFFYKKVTKPIGGLIQASHIIEEGEFGYRIEKNANSKEFEYLTEAFNSMSEKLKHQFETIYSEELALKDARIMALQLQINPHFLNNTLEIINWEARINENYKVSRMIENLSIMLEATMDRRHRRFVTLAEEISYVDAYLYIIAQRLGERLHVTKDIDKMFLNEKIPRLIIQPIIENAVEHGISGQTHAKILLHVYRDGNKMIIEVINTGSISKEDEDKIKMLLTDNYEPGEFGSASLGIRNVNRRLKIIYGEECGLSIKNDENGQTVSRIFVQIDNNDTHKNNIC